MTTRPVRVVVVAYHAVAELDACLVSLGPGVPVTVVDNSSSAGVAEVAVRRGAHYVDPGRNLGFAAGVNVALRPLLESDSPSDVLLLNPDAQLTAETLDILRGYLVRRERVAAVAPRLVGPEGGNQRVAWPFPSPLRGWAQALGLGRLPSRSTFVIGAVLLLRWEALRQVGLFDERYFLYAEEADWQRRARALGWRSAVCPDAAAVHRGGGTSEDAPRREALFHAAHETYIRKWYGRAGWAAYRCAGLAGAAVRAAVLPGDRRAEAARRAVLYARGPRRAAGLPRSV
jgi:GT2 family glycosyltransferase